MRRPIHLIFLALFLVYTAAGSFSAGRIILCVEADGSIHIETDVHCRCDHPFKPGHQDDSHEGITSCENCTDKFIQADIPLTPVRVNPAPCAFGPVTFPAMTVPGHDRGPSSHNTVSPAHQPDLLRSVILRS